MKKGITTDQLWSVFTIQNRFLEYNKFSQEDLEELKSQYPVKGGIRRKAALTAIRDIDSIIRPDPSEFEKLRGLVLAEVGINYSDVVGSPERTVKKVLKRGCIKTEEEFYLLNEIVSGSSPDEVEDYEEIDRIVFEYNSKN